MNMIAARKRGRSVRRPAHGAARAATRELAGSRRRNRRGLLLALGGLALFGAAGVAVVSLRRSRRSRRALSGPVPTPSAPSAQGSNGARRTNGTGSLVERRSQSDPDALKALVEGTTSRIGFDLERLNHLKEANYKPLMEYLQYIQVQRGGADTLVFVRTRDLDELAGMVGQSRDEFVRQSKRLGILLSMN
jgi:hypothetical protein